MVAGGFDASVAASSATAASSSSTGTTRLTNPMRSASAASDPAAGHHQLERLLRRHRADERHGDHVRPQPDVDLGRAELRVVAQRPPGRTPGPGRTRRPARSPGPGRWSACRAPTGRANRAGQLAPALVQVEVAARRRPSRSRSAPAREGLLPGPGDDDHPHRRIRLGPGDGVADALDHRPRDRVAAVGPVDRHGGHTVSHPVEDLAVRHQVRPPAAAIWSPPPLCRRPMTGRRVGRR